MGKIFTAVGLHEVDRSHRILGCQGRNGLPLSGLFPFAETTMTVGRGGGGGTCRPK